MNLTASGPAISYLANDDPSNMPMLSRTARHSSPTGPCEFDRRRLGRLYRLRTLWGKPKRYFEAIRRTKYGVRLLQSVMKSRNLVRPCSRPLVVRAQELKSVLIELLDLLYHVWRACKIAESIDVHGKNVTVRFSIDHPLRQGQRCPVPLTKTRHDPTAGPVVLYSMHRAYQWVTVRERM